MRHLVATTAVTLLVLCLVSTASRTTAAETALATSTWSVEIGTDFGTGNEDASFAIRRHSSASSAFRFGIEVDLDKLDGDGTRTVTGSPDEDATVFNESNFSAFSIQWMRFASIRDNVTATFAVGPVVQMERQGFREATGQGTPLFDEREFKQNTTTFGLDLGLGVEWFFNRRVSLGGQTGLRATIGTSKLVDIDRSGTGLTYDKTETSLDGDVKEITTETGIYLTGYF